MVLLQRKELCEAGENSYILKFCGATARQYEDFVRVRGQWQDALSMMEAARFWFWAHESGGGESTYSRKNGKRVENLIT